MGKALYRSNRPRSLDEVIGQDHIVKTLKNSLKTGKISHAYLFTGPRGVGKTSVARILAREVNSIKYDEDNVHLDIIEIDAASNRRIDEIRDLRDKVHIAPAAAKYKVYIIDEVHMLTKEAFNALLKTLEEPPAHCIFILATTESHKIPETIISRTQRFNFKPIDTESASSHLESIAKKEKIDISKEALELLAQHGKGSFRDSISLLDQLGSLKGKIDVEAVNEILGLPPDKLVMEIAEAIEQGQTGGIIKLMDKVKEQAIEPQAIASALSQKIRESSVHSNHVGSNELSLLQELVNISSSINPQASLEIALLKACLADGSDNKRDLGPIKTASLKVEKDASIEDAIEDDVTESKKPVTIKKSGINSRFDMKYWPIVISKVKGEATSLYTALRLAVPKLDGDTLTLCFKFPLHQKKIAEQKAKILIGEFIEEVSGAKLIIEAVVDKSIDPEPASVSDQVKPTPEENEHTQNISNIFGGIELLKS